MIEQAIDDPCERRSSLQEICPKRPSFTHEWMPRNILIVVGIILQMALKIVLFGPTVFGWLGFLRFYWEKAVHWLVWLFNFFNQLRTWLKCLKTMVGIRWSFSRHRFSSVVFFFENSALKTLWPKCWQPLQPKSEELSENYCTQSQSPFNLKRFGNYSIGDLQISQNGLWLKRLVPIEHHLCGKRATVTSRQFYLIIFLTHFVPI